MPPAGRTEQDQADDHGDPFRATHRWFGFPESAHPVQDKSSTPRGEPTTPLGVQIPFGILSAGGQTVECNGGEYPMVLRHSASHVCIQVNGWVDVGRVAVEVGQAGSDVDDGAAQGGCACAGAAITARVAAPRSTHAADQAPRIRHDAVGKGWAAVVMRRREGASSTIGRASTVHGVAVEGGLHIRAEPLTPQGAAPEAGR